MTTLTEFEQGQGNIAFSWLAQEVAAGKAKSYSRQKIADAIRQRAKTPELISQENAALCGPAAFMYCIAKQDKEAYIRYVVDLLTTGEGHLGDLIVTPSADCLKAEMPLDKDKIHAVDWIALASLRDSSNAIASMKSPASHFAGITLPSSMEAWFRATGWFRGVCNSADGVFRQNIDNLLDANERRGYGYVCLFIVAALLESSAGDNVGMEKVGISGVPKTKYGTANHWVVMDSPIMLHGLPTPKPREKHPADLESKRIDFQIYTWGGLRHITSRYPGLTIGQLLYSYYGFVSAAIK